MNQPTLTNDNLLDQVQELLEQMSLPEKVGQMTQAERMTCTPEQAAKYNLGSILSSAGSSPENNHPQAWVDMVDSYWQAGFKYPRAHKHIPIMYGLDAIHGNNNVYGATVFPHNIGLGATGDAALISKTAEITRREVLATGVDWVFGPNLSVTRDKHWGRTYESFSETPEVVTEYAPLLVNALQNDLNIDSVIACVKHWIGDGGTHQGIDQGDTRLPFAELMRIHGAPYEHAIEAGVLTIMCSFSSFNGTKCHANRFLLTDVLKGQLGFPGFVVSDMQGIDYLSDDFYRAVEQGVNAGIDMFMLPENWQAFIEHLTNHVEMGSVSMSRINDAVSRILYVKMAYGLFDKPNPKQRIWSNHSSFGSDEHRAVAREAVRKSQVLLKNKGILPLRKDARVYVAGKNAHNLGHQCGGFTITWQGESGNDTIKGTSIFEGIQALCENATLASDMLGEDAAAEDCDVAIVVIGEKPYAEGMGDIREGNDNIVKAGSMVNGQLNVIKPKGSSLELGDLYPEDIALINNLHKKGIPIVTLLVSGRPLLIQDALSKSKAFVASWLPGSEGAGIADVLFGEADFTGRLACSWPKQSRPTVNVGDKDYQVLFPFGYGLSYQSQQDIEQQQTA